MARLEIRPLRLTDKSVADALLCEAFAGFNPGGVVERETALAPETCFLAFDDGVAAGLVCAIEYGPVSYIGPMAVAPQYQGKGTGSLLLQFLMDLLQRRGSSTLMLDATEAGEPLYRKFGFEEIGRTFDVARAAGLGIVNLPGVDDMDKVLALDSEVFGANRVAMLRRLLKEESAALYTADNGYLVSQTRVLGPFLARNVDVAGDLLDHALSRGAVASRVLAPVENRDAERLLVSRGFRVQREVKHMRLGKPVEMRRDLMYGLASFALG
jgi:predicted N-acetyltransferase YhbS